MEWLLFHVNFIFILGIHFPFTAELWSKEVPLGFAWRPQNAGCQLLDLIFENTTHWLTSPSNPDLRSWNSTSSSRLPLPTTCPEWDPLPLPKQEAMVAPLIPWCTEQQSLPWLSAVPWIPPAPPQCGNHGSIPNGCQRHQFPRRKCQVHSYF